MKLSSRFFIYTMARESYEDDLSFPNDFFYFDKNSGILWSKGPDSFDVDWTQIEGENYFEHRRIYTYVEQRKELENNGFKIEKEKLIDQGVGQAKMFAAWLSLK